MFFLSNLQLHFQKLCNPDADGPLPNFKNLPKHITNCVTDKNIFQIVNLTKTLLRMQRMKPTSINHVNTCFNFKSCIGDLCSSLFYGEQADARVNERHDILADCKSNQDIIGVPEDEANIVKKCVTCSSFDSCDVPNLVCPMVDRLMLIDMYTTVYMTTTTSIAMYVYAYYCCEYANYDSCLAKAVLGSAMSTLGLFVLAVVATAFYQQTKMATSTEYAEDGKKKEEEKKKKTALPTLPRVWREFTSSQS